MHPSLSPPISKANSNKHQQIVYQLTALSQSPTFGHEAIGPSERGTGFVPTMPERKQEKARSEYPPIDASSFFVLTPCRVPDLTSNHSHGQPYPVSYPANLLEPMLMSCVDRAEFHKSIGLDKKDFAAIEYLLRKGQRQLEMYSSPGIKDIR